MQASAAILACSRLLGNQVQLHCAELETLAVCLLCWLPGWSVMRASSASRMSWHLSTTLRAAVLRCLV